MQKLADQNLGCVLRMGNNLWAKPILSMTQKFLRAIFLLLFMAEFASAQTIKGSVKDGKTGEFMPFTNVFINNTTIGTTTDEKGRFELSRTDLPGTFSLVASFVGYTTREKLVSVGPGETQTIDFVLTPLESVLTEVELKSRRDKPWERNLRRFENIFLALPDDAVAGEVEILNPWVLDFQKVNPDKGPNYIQATAQEPLIIDNKALGYRVTYYLQDYKYYKNKSSFYGLAFFEDKTPKDSTEAANYLLNKQTSYQGSIKHLMKSILLQEAPAQGFDLYVSLPEQMNRRRTNTYTVELGESIVYLPQESIRRIPLRNGNFRIIWPDRVEVHFLKKNWRNDYYLDIYHPIGWVSAPGGYFDIDRNGVPIDPTQVVLSGYIGRPRMGRSIPHDYVPPSTFENLAAEVDLGELMRNQWENRRERPYFTTNKPFYYPGETVWFGGAMLYKNPFYQDSLSQVIHVELRDEKTNLVFTEQYRIDSGKIDGSFALPDSLDKGDYFIRAYTEWMRNYPEKDFFLRALPILEREENVEQQTLPEIDYAGDLVFGMKSESIPTDTGTKLKLALSLKDALDEAVSARFSISVTNSEQVTQIANQQTILSAYEWLDEEEGEPLQIHPSYAIEYGVTVAGLFEKTKRKQPDVSPITIVRGDLLDYGIVKTDSGGYFRATGLNYTGTDTLAFAALDSKRKPYGNVTLTPRTIPVFKGSFPRNEYKTYRANEGQLAYDFFGEYILMEEFVAEDQRIEALEDRNYGYGTPDQQYTKEDLDNWPGNTLDRVIGMRFGNGRMGNYNYGLDEGEPLIIIDGFRYPYSDGETAKDVLQTFITDEVKSVSVYTLNANVFGLAGFAGVIMIETIRGDRKVRADTKFDDLGFAKYPVKGFAETVNFPNLPNLEMPLQQRSTLYWEPLVETNDGAYELEVYLPPGVKKLSVRIEGVTEDGIPFWKVFEWAN
ncbi:carboxypeptidase-like regulatory domain-containing protein [Algoriphagus namhaensis]